jgi:hypothetical protein
MNSRDDFGVRHLPAIKWLELFVWVGLIVMLLVGHLSSFPR